MDIPRVGVVELVRDAPDDIQDRWLRIRVDDAPEEILRYGETLRHDVPRRKVSGATTFPVPCGEVSPRSTGLS